MKEELQIRYVEMVASEKIDVRQRLLLLEILLEQGVKVPIPDSLKPFLEDKKNYHHYFEETT